ncbi:MAG TPA: hypothetical protein VIT67_08510 [Povalibacter sp.]
MSRHPRLARRGFGALAAGVLLSMLVAGLVDAVERVTFEVERIDGAGWSAEGVAVQIDVPERTTATATVARLKLSSSQQELRNVRIECPAVEISADLMTCSHARLTGNFPQLGEQSLAGRLSYARETGALAMQLDGLRLGEGKAGIAATLDATGWRARLTLVRVGLAPLMKLAQQMQLSVPLASADGTVTGSMTASGFSASLRSAHIEANFADATVSNAEGTLATDKLTFALEVDVTPVKRDWKFDAAIKSRQGQAYAQPIFLDLTSHPLDMSARGTWRGDGPLVVDHFRLDHQQVAQGEGSATLDLKLEQPLQELRLNLKALQFPGAYETYFQPLLIDTNFKSLQTAGQISGQLAIENGAPHSVELKLAGVTLDDGSRHFVLRGVTGEAHWADATDSANMDDEDKARGSAAVADSVLSWESGTLLNIDLGRSELHFNTRGRQVRLLQPSTIPVLDGAINLESFRIRNAGLDSVAFIVDATIEPISVRQVCQAFGWPEFGGRIGGKISKLRMRERVVTLGTTLEAQVFDGTVKISDLRLEQPFSTWPRFQSSIAFDNLDLDLVTSAFSFGNITGRLSGSINGLQLFNWQPVAFDARLYTPPGDRSRHRISQRAVESIGSIGGGGAGVTAALSGGVMRFFDDFNYDRLGVSCRLENEVCKIDGVAPAPNGGYYLVKGKGVPRIDVIGDGHRVDWPRLVQQLVAATKSKGPVVR